MWTYLGLSVCWRFRLCKYLISEERSSSPLSSYRGQKHKPEIKTLCYILSWNIIPYSRNMFPFSADSLAIFSTFLHQNFMYSLPTIPPKVWVSWFTVKFFWSYMHKKQNQTHYCHLHKIHSHKIQINMKVKYIWIFFMLELSYQSLIAMITVYSRREDLCDIHWTTSAKNLMYYY